MEHEEPGLKIKAKGMTGLRPQTIGVYDLLTHFRDAAPDAVTFGQYFKRHGYRVEGLGKIYHTGHGNKDDADTWNMPSWKPKGGGYPRTAPGKGSVLGRAIRTDRHRLVGWKKPGASADTAECELYDYHADPLDTVEAHTTANRGQHSFPTKP